MLELWSSRTLKGRFSKFKTGTVGKGQVAGIEGRTSADIKKDSGDIYTCSSAGLSTMCNGMVNSVPAEMLIDTDSVFIMIRYNLFKEIEKRNQHKFPVVPCKSTAVSGNSEVIDIHGVVDVTISINDV